MPFADAKLLRILTHTRKIGFVDELSVFVHDS